MTISESLKEQFKIKNVKLQYEKNNFKVVELSKELETVVVFFSSNALYYPNDDSVFDDVVIKKDRYEWTNTRIDNADKIVYIRDVYKQWYVSGISQDYPNIKKMKELLELLVGPYKNVYFVGISAGGYAAILLGLLIEKEVFIYAFSPQIELNSQLATEKHREKNFFLATNVKDENNYFDLIKRFQDVDWSNVNIISPLYSISDKFQIDKINESGINPNTLYIKSNKHGLIIFPECLNVMINNRKNVNNIKSSGRYYVMYQILGLNGFVNIVVSTLLKKIKRRLKCVVC